MWWPGCWRGFVSTMLAVLFLAIFLPTSLFLTLVNSAPIPNGETSSEINAPSAKRSKQDTSPRCKLQFSEVLLDFQNPGDDIYPFIELKQSCVKRPGPVPKNILSSYKLLILQSDPLNLVTVVDFKHFRFNEKKDYIVIGSPKVPNVDISMSSPNVESSFSRTDDKSMLPNPLQGSYAMVLIRDDRKDDGGFNLFITQNGVQKPRLLSNPQIATISSKAVDMMILQDLDYLSQYKFSTIWKPELPERASMFSEYWKAFSKANGKSSLSMCLPTYEGFNSKAFISTSATPGLENACPTLLTVEPIEIENNNFPTTTTRPIIHLADAEYVSTHKQFLFDPQWVQKCGKHFPIGEKILENPSLRDWVKFSPETSSCRFWCFACTKYLQLGFRPDIKNKPHIIKTGYFSEDIYENSAKIKAHEVYPLHQEALAFHKFIKVTDSTEAVNATIRQFEDMEIANFNATMNTLLFAYASMKAGISFQAYESLMKAIELMGANVGWLQHTNDAAQYITKVISTTLHLKLLKQLVLTQTPFSILVDSSTTFNQPYLAVYIQTLENNVPVTRFYCLIHLAEGERGRMMAEAVKKQVELDSIAVPGFRNYFASKLVAIVSDGASNMVGIHDSFKVHLSTYIGRNIPNIECLAHKLDNSFKLGVKQDVEAFKDFNRASLSDKTKIEQLTYFENFEKFINGLYKFYAGRGHKKWIHLLSTAEDLGIVPKRMKYVFPIRWSDSHYKALQTVHHNYYALVEDLRQVQVDPGFDQCTKSTAVQIYDRLTDKTFMLVLHEFLDVLTVFKIASKRFQQASAIIIGKVEFVYDVIYQLEQYKTVPGSWLKDFLESCVCADKCDGGRCTLDMYDQCLNVILNNVLLKNNFNVVLYYSFVRNYLYNNMIAAIKKYFKLELLESFELFNPARLDFSFDSTHNHQSIVLDLLYTENAASIIEITHISTQEKIQHICSFYNMQADACSQFEQDWTVIIHCIITSGGMDSSIEPAEFWSRALSKCEGSWTSLAREVVGYALVTPFSSSECERGFSLMNSIKTKSRSCLDKGTLDALIRVKANGPEVESLNAYEYTVEFLKLYARVDDKAANGGGKHSDKTCSASMSTTE